MIFLSFSIELFVSHPLVDTCRLFGMGCFATWTYSPRRRLFENKVIPFSFLIHRSQFFALKTIDGENDLDSSHLLGLGITRNAFISTLEYMHSMPPIKGIGQNPLRQTHGVACGIICLMTFGDGIPLTGIINDTNMTLLMIVWLLIYFVLLLIPSNFTNLRGSREGGLIAVDHASGFINLTNQFSLYGGETLKAKHSFEH